MESERRSSVLVNSSAGCGRAKRLPGMARQPSACRNVGPVSLSAESTLSRNAPCLNYKTEMLMASGTGGIPAFFGFSPLGACCYRKTMAVGPLRFVFE